MASYNNKTIKNMTYNGKKVKKWYHNGTKVFSSGNIVTYHVDTNVTYQEEVDSGAHYIPPKTFTPELTGYEFVGWCRNNINYSADFDENDVMGDEPITVYAVFKRVFTVTFDGNGSTGGSMEPITKTEYYNNGKVDKAVLILPANGFTRTDYVFDKWDVGAPGMGMYLTSDITITAQWTQGVYNYGYTGGMQSFTAPKAGTYQLEVWGAQGAANYSGSGENGSPGYGGYGKGNVTLTKNQVIYICVGGMGRKGTGVGGYNGGGRGFVSYQNAQAGGGATHIGTRNGTLTAYGNTSGLFIVAGGGGGAGIRLDSSDGGLGSGGSGGGSSGGPGTGHWGYSGSSYGAGNGGTQTAGGAGGNNAGNDNGSFGRGGYCVHSGNNAGGGGGLYGGGAGNTYGDDSYGGGGGGSGYIGGVSNGTWSNGVRSGDGYARITLLSTSS